MPPNRKPSTEKVADLRAQAAAWREVARRLSLRMDRETAYAQASRYDELADRLKTAEERDEKH
jgi:hypothetical protein